MLCNVECKHLGFFLGYPRSIWCNDGQKFNFSGIYPDLLHICDLQICHDLISSSLLELTDNGPREQRLQDLCRSYQEWCHANSDMARMLKTTLGLFQNVEVSINIYCSVFFTYMFWYPRAVSVGSIQMAFRCPFCFKGFFKALLKQDPHLRRVGWILFNLSESDERGRSPFAALLAMHCSGRWERWIQTCYVPCSVPENG